MFINFDMISNGFCSDYFKTAYYRYKLVLIKNMQYSTCICKLIIPISSCSDTAEMNEPVDSARDRVGVSPFKVGVAEGMTGVADCRLEWPDCRVGVPADCCEGVADCKVGVADPALAVSYCVDVGDENPWLAVSYCVDVGDEADWYRPDEDETDW